MKILLWIIIGGGILFALPSTMYLAVFKGIFGRVPPKPTDTHVWNLNDAEAEADCREALESFYRLPMEDVYIRAYDGLRLHAAYLNRGQDKLALLVHGYRTKPEINFALQIRDFLANGFDLLVIDHRAHGESEGRFVSMGQRECRDVLAWVDWAPYRKIAVYGMSMGCAAVGYASDRMDPEKVRVLVMDCGFSNFYDELNHKCDLWHFPKAGFANAENLLTRLLLRSDLRKNTADSLAACKIPVFFLHGSDDAEVPVREMGRQYEACAAPKECRVVEGACHACSYAMGGEAVQKQVFRFVNRYID